MTEWRPSTIGEACDVVNGGTPKTAVADYWGGDHLWITPAEMGKRSSPYVGETARTLTDSGLASSSARLLPPSSIILSTRAPIGHLVINTSPMATNQGCRGLIPREGLNYKFLYYYLLSRVELLDSLGTGTTFKELSATRLKQVPILVPPPTEQAKIVKLLDRAMDDIESARRHTRANAQSATDIFRSHRHSVMAAGRDTWTQRCLPDLAANLDSRRIPITKSERKSGTYPYYGASGVVDHVADYIFDEDALLVSEDGANLLARTTPIAFSVTGKYWVNNHAHVLKFEDLATQRFVEHYLESVKLDEYVRGAAQPKLTQKALNSIPIPIPDAVSERAAVVASIDEVLARAKELAAVYERKVAALTALTGSVLHRALSGELRGMTA